MPEVARVRVLRVSIAGRQCRAIAVDSPAPGKGHDRWFAVGGMVGVADGATPLSGATGDPGMLAGLVLDHLARAEQQAARPRLATALAALRGAGDGRLAGASATLAVVLDTPRGPRAMVLGDCEVHIVRAGAVTRVLDRRLAVLDGRALRSLRRRLERGESPEAARAGVQPELRANRARLNTPAGYWAVAPNEPDAAHHAIVRVVPSDFDALVLATDGFARIWSLFAVADPLRLARSGPGQLEEIVGRLRALEQQRRDAPDLAQFSPSDDATAVIVVPDPGGC